MTGDQIGNVFNVELILKNEAHRSEVKAAIEAQFKDTERVDVLVED